MLAAEAMRLAAIEVLLPTASQLSGGPYPTLAKHRVYDSKSAAIEDLDRNGPATPVIALYKPESGVALRGEASAADDTVADAVLDIVVEMAVIAKLSDDEGGEEFSDATADDDPTARLVLATLCAQIRRLLERSQQGGLWRTLVRRIIKTEYLTFAVPNLGLRWQRVTIRMHCEIRDDDLDMETEGLPEPMRTLHAKLPEGSYAKGKLTELAAYFAPEIIPRLGEIHVHTDAGESGPTFPTI